MKHFINQRIEIFILQFPILTNFILDILLQKAIEANS